MTLLDRIWADSNSKGAAEQERETPNQARIAHVLTRRPAYGRSRAVTVNVDRGAQHNSRFGARRASTGPN